MLKYGAFYILLCLEKLFNFVLDSGQYPSSGIIISLYKSGSPDDPNYHGITITSCLGKLFNSILNTRLGKFLSDQKSSTLNKLDLDRVVEPQIIYLFY